ncbi:MAG: hypothetical protein OEV40_16360 [Acidimicrobiia bacterium]|nr:hypothetical protein [Acidimicrobiia bacterium]
MVGDKILEESAVERFHSLGYRLHEAWVASGVAVHPELRPRDDDADGLPEIRFAGPTRWED